MRFYINLLLIVLLSCISASCSAIPQNNDRNDWIYKDLKRLEQYIEQENAKFREFFADKHNKEEYLKIKEEIDEFYSKSIENTFPVLGGHYYYYDYNNDSGRIYARKDARKAKDEQVEEVLLDTAEIKNIKKHASLVHHTVSPNHQYVAYGIDTDGADLGEIWIKSLEKGDVITKIKSAGPFYLCWASDSSGLYYVTPNKKGIQNNVRYDDFKSHKNDFIFAPDDEDAYVSIHTSDSKKYTFISHGSLNINGLLFFGNDKALHRLVEPTDSQYQATDTGDYFYIIKSSPDGSTTLWRTKVDQPEQKYWELLLQDTLEEAISQVNAYADYLVLKIKKHGLDVFRIYKTNQNKNREENEVGELSIDNSKRNPKLKEAAGFKAPTYETSFNEPSYICNFENSDFKSNLLRY